MGKWIHRPRRRFCRQEKLPDPSPLPFHPQPPPPSGSRQDGVPYWEKQYCTLVGSIPWWKVVDAKNYMYGSSMVLNWNDSGAEEAFQSAKKRFWADINGLPFDASLPDPNIYIDAIDWNPNIDPALIKEVDREYFAPDEGEGEGKIWQTNKKAKYSDFVPPDEHNTVPDTHTNSWECDNIQDSGHLINKAPGRNQWKTNRDDPWERGITQGDGTTETEKNAWEDRRNESRGWNQMEDSITAPKSWDNGVNPWEGGCQDVASVKGSRWADPVSNSWGCNQESKNLGRGENSWKYGLSQNSKSLKDREWRDRGGDEWGQKQWESHNNQKNNLDFGITNSGRGARNDGGHKRGHPHQYRSGYKSSRLQGSDYQTGNYWSRENNRKRVSFA
ncbi:hypothetical protein ACFX13_029150 [Malus domestica]|uniref:uncharacterized protein LOC126610793 n=1 Tax=Malus sylvestris TaxID=3752 RepID=UPI0021AC6777|nr:uncharacterized protein LOC126610793 [Malus sylvestris]